MKPFRDRTEAGELLARRLAGCAPRDDVIVLALPRGGVPVGFEVARALGAPLDVFVVRKLGAPGHEELAMGAIASGGVRVLNEAVASQIKDAATAIEAAAAVEQLELERRERSYRGNRPPLDLEGKTVIVVDDGLATGATMRAAARALRKRHVARLIIAVPVGAPDTCAELHSEADEVICLSMPDGFHAVGQFYDDFTQTSDEEVCECLRRADVFLRRKQ